MLVAIDVGSNTVRMLLADIVQGKIQPIAYERRITRLKGGQTEKGLAPAAMERTLSALNELAKIARRTYTGPIVIVGTEAVRSATNCDAFVESVRQATSLEMEIISGEEEAALSAKGALSVIDPEPENAVIIDIGGGSTEIVFVKQSETLFRYSCPLGVVRLAEMAPDYRNEFILETIADLGSVFSASNLQEVISSSRTQIIGTAGTITTLAALDMKMTTYDWQRVNNYRMASERIVYFLEKLSSMTLAERESMPGMEGGRGDLIIPGLNILQKLLNILDKNELTISDFGLLEGLILQSAADTAIH